jgi:PST family polysaccharide transporter
MGVAFMWVGFSSTLVTFATGALIVRTLGEEANGYYSAAWTISGMFANFVLSAMGMDFLPRLTAANKNNTLVCKLVNEQTEIGILVSIAGLVATLFFAPLLIQIIYSKSFAVSATLLPWLILGVFGRVISWPMGYILMAKGYAGLFAVNDLLFNFLNMVIILVGLSLFGLEGAAVSFFIIYILYTAWMLCLTKRLVGFSWSSRVLALVGFSMTFLGIGFLLPKFIPGFTASLTGFILCVFLFAFSAREIIHRLGESHPLSNFTAKSPLISWIFTEKKNSNQIKRS